MFRVAVVDDEKKIVEQILLLLKSYREVKGVEFYAEGFVDEGNFDSDRLSGFDVVFLDINMPGVNGLQIAKKLRAESWETVIIFCTNYAQYALNGYEVGAAGYILKPVTEYSIFKATDRAFGFLQKIRHVPVNKEKIILKGEDGQQPVNLSDLVFVEVIKHDLFFHVSARGGIKTYRMRGTMREVCDRLERSGFVRCCASYVVNLSHVSSVSKSNMKIRVTGDASIPISRNYKDKFFEEFEKQFRN